RRNLPAAASLPQRLNEIIPGQPLRDRSRGAGGRCGPALVLLLCGCGGPQSALEVAGREAEAVAGLFWVMLIGAGVIWALVIGTAVSARWCGKYRHDERVARWFLLGGGVAFPVVVLTALLIYGLLLMKELRPAEAELRLAVSGEQWWWRVRYELPGGV